MTMEAAQSPELKAKTTADSKTTMTELVMPNDTNHLGNLMGGNLMKWMDIICAMCATRHTGRPVVTASVDNISFKSPIRLSEITVLHAFVTRAFNTSLEVYVEVFAENAITGDKRKSNDAFFTFVAVDLQTQRPVKVPQLTPQTEREKDLHEGALRRRELRLILSGRMDPSEATDLKRLFQS